MEIPGPWISGSRASRTTRPADRANRDEKPHRNLLARPRRWITIRTGVPHGTRRQGAPIPNVGDEIRPPGSTGRKP
jgi:hypothetical protein